MANNALLTPSVIAKETLVRLENNLVFASKVNRMFENQFVAIGSTITVRKPVKFRAVKQVALDLQDVQEPSTSITVNTNCQVAFAFSIQDLTLTIEEFSERYLASAAAEIANQIDYDVASNVSMVNNEVGNAGLPSSFADLAAVGQRMDEAGAPQDARVLVLNPACYWSIAVGLSGLYVRNVAEGALKGFLAAIANFEIFMDQNIQSLTNGAFAGTGKVNSALQTGANLVTNTWTGNIATLFLGGEVITIQGVNAINPRSRVSTGALQNFVVTGPVASDSSGNATIPIYPAIVTSGPYQTVDVSPGAGANITVHGAANGTTAKNVGFVKDAFGLVTVPQELPQGVDFAARQMYKNISMSIIRDYDINAHRMPCRIDVLYGTTTFYPELACRLST